MKDLTHIALMTLFLSLLAAGCRRAEQKAAAPVTPSVTVAHPIARKVNEMDEFTGRLSSPETVEIRSRVSGYIEKVHFIEGRDVKQGDLLFTIDRRPYQAAVDRLKAELGGARAGLNWLEAKPNVQKAWWPLKRFRQMFTKPG